MRTNGDWRTAQTIKADWYNSSTIKPHIVFEDRESQIPGFLELGIPVLHLIRPNKPV